MLYVYCILYTSLYPFLNKLGWLANPIFNGEMVNTSSFIVHLSLPAMLVDPRVYFLRGLQNVCWVLFLLRSFAMHVFWSKTQTGEISEVTRYGVREYVKIAFRNHDFINIGFYRLSGTWYKSHSRIESLLEKMSELCNFWNLCKSRRNNDFCQNTVKTPHHMVLASWFLPCFLWFPLVLSAWQRFRL